MTPTDAIDELNLAPTETAFEQLYDCCHCRRWAHDMVAARPFENALDALAHAERFWASATEAEILEAFSAHARIGDIEKLRSRFAGRAKDEQGQVLQTDESVLRELHQLNIDYEQRHGFIFIVCAKGRSTEAMLQTLRERIDNTRTEELRNGAREQGQITRLRLLQWLQPTEQGTL